nr:hypothetical protein Iba_chr12cCG6450 [Ipomoea batatas]
MGSLQHLLNQAPRGRRHRPQQRRHLRLKERDPPAEVTGGAWRALDWGRRRRQRPVSSSLRRETSTLLDYHHGRQARRSTPQERHTIRISNSTNQCGSTIVISPSSGTASSRSPTSTPRMKAQTVLVFLRRPLLVFHRHSSDCSANGNLFLFACHQNQRLFTIAQVKWQLSCVTDMLAKGCAAALKQAEDEEQREFFGKRWSTSTMKIDMHGLETYPAVKENHHQTSDRPVGAVEGEEQWQVQNKSIPRLPNATADEYALLPSICARDNSSGCQAH